MTKKTVTRSAISGRFVRTGEAKRHPSTTVKEHVYVPKPKTK
jgi:hypothetical protein